MSLFKLRYCNVLYIVYNILTLLLAPLPHFLAYKMGNLVFIKRPVETQMQTQSLRNLFITMSHGLW